MQAPKYTYCQKCLLYIVSIYSDLFGKTNMTGPLECVNLLRQNNLPDLSEVFFQSTRIIIGWQDESFDKLSGGTIKIMASLLTDVRF